ncbi:DUF481 domain-containing protein [uncultured Halopseudomonas sp.]|uniref:DUF481 domain-containing protein n=1 Tax=uncultured Halopseudomonas sp. TaxID=2901193 RepID=UPI0030EC0BEC|tara:strand:- start:7856 stop:8872 length:1017 start_codon:yes stop_codon:yes gene_type:complete
MFRCRFLLAVAPLLLVSTVAIADTLWLTNGDRISGTIELLQDGELVMNTQLAGRIRVGVEDISTFEAEHALLIKTLGQAEGTLTVSASQTAGTVNVLNGGTEPVLLKINSIQQMLEPSPVIEDWVWTGDVTGALDIKNTNTDQRDLDLAFDTRARHGDWRHVLGGEFERDYRDDVKSRHFWQADYGVSWFFDDKWFWQTAVGYQRDHLSEIAKRRQFGMGPGYEWWNDALGRFETSARLDRVTLENRDGSTDVFNALGLQWELRRYLFSKRFEAIHNAEALIPDDPAINFALDAELGVRYLLNSWASLSLLTEWDYVDGSSQNSINHTRYRLGFGVGW